MKEFTCTFTNEEMETVLTSLMEKGIGIQNEINFYSRGFDAEKLSESDMIKLVELSKIKTLYLRLAMMEEMTKERG